MIIDSHTHIFEAGHGGPFDLPSSAEDLIREMDAQHVDMCVVLPLDGIAGNEFVHRECARFPDRLSGLYNPDFQIPGETVTKMSAFFERHRAHGLKIHPRQQGVSVKDSIMIEVLGWADEHQLPVLFDAFPFGPSLGDTRLHPLAYHDAAQRFPQLRMVLAHAGGYKMMEAFMVAKSNPNVFLDLSFTPIYFRGSSLADDCTFLCRRLPAGRILYGSDFPYVRLGESLEYAQQLTVDLAAPARDEFFGGAATQIFGLRGR